MPRQDYSLPQVAPLPRLAQLKSPVVVQSAAKQKQETIDKDAVMVDHSESSASKATDGDSDNEYDMLDDDEEILKLMGPLEDELHGLHLKDSTSTTSSPADTAAAAATNSSAFVDMLLSETQPPSDPNLTTTENGASTFISTENACLDLFFEILKGTDAETVQRLARAAWAQSPLDTLRLIFQLRSIIHGKGDRKEFYYCMDFLRQEHPRTLLFNLRYIPDHGYWKDLLNWLVFEVRKDHKDFELTTRPARPKKPTRSTRPTRPRRHKIQSTEKVQAEAKVSTKTKKTPEERKRAIEEAEERNRQESIKARKERLAKAEALLGRARDAFKENDFYRVLHLEVARLFANALVRDKARLQKGQSVSLAAKWCPSLNQFHDNHTLIASTIAQILYPTKLAGEDHATYVNRVRQLYRQEYYVPLRKATPVLETFMASDRWNEIIYNRVPAVAMKNNKELFEAHDKDRFAEYLASVSKGETTIAAQALLPHQLVSEATSLQDVDRDDLRIKTIEAQWESYIDRLAQTGKMDSSIAICDVSGSMSGQPMEVAIALSLLLAQLSRPPFNRVVITFSANPTIHQIKEGSLVDKIQAMRRMDWGMNTDLQRAFEVILQRAIASKLARSEMVKTLFIFSDMEFDQAVHGSRSDELFTNYAVVKRKFEAAGYDLPQIVFWNLAGSSRGNKPAKANQRGVALVSGFSGMLMKLFLDGSDLAQGIDPVTVMRKAIDDKAFTRLTVRD
ncbi:hypothetical protein BGX23_006336 [Mortierella sp. AD031]|nr:hypothetical protein BGX23_006336 [Mortierella sp. AD031]